MEFVCSLLAELKLGPKSAEAWTGVLKGKKVQQLLLRFAAAEIVEAIHA